MDEQQFTPKIASQQISVLTPVRPFDPNQYDAPVLPIDPVAPNHAPKSAYISPTKEERQKQAKEALEQCPQESVSYFIHRSPIKSNSNIDYARYLIEAGKGAPPIEQPIYEPPIFVPSFPPQTAQTPGLPIRYDHYVEVGKAPARTSPSKLPPGY